MTMLPGTVEVVVRIAGAGIVADPLAVGVHVRDVGMVWGIAKIAVGLHLRRAMERCGPPCRWRASADVAATPVTLGLRRER
jgi:hypothetical protein